MILVSIVLSFYGFASYVKASSCKEFPSNIESCIHQTTDQCFWNSRTDTCEPISKVNKGCDKSLNRLSCVRQLFSAKNNNILEQCYFGQRCQDASSQQLNNLGCSPNLSKFACLYITTPGVKCQWLHDQCSNLSNFQLIKSINNTIPRCIVNSTILKQSSEEDDYIQQDEQMQVTQEAGEETDENWIVKDPGQLNSEDCIQNFNKSVNINVCASLEVLKACTHGRYIDNLECIDVQDKDLIRLNCETQGLNRYGCQSIITPNQSCLFDNGFCQTVTATISKGLTCNSSINRQACLDFTDPSQACKWNSSNITCYSITSFDSCESLVNVSVSACAASTNQCVYNSTNRGCRKSNSSSDFCSAIGLSQSGCFNLTRPCHYTTKCQKLTIDDLQLYRCSSNLNQAGCYALITTGQLCQWSLTLQKCLNLNITPTQSCTSFSNVNGNVCQAVTLDGCKYNSSSNACVKSLTKDKCSTPYLNIGGCVQVLHKNSICQWMENSQECSDINVIRGITKCNDLRNVNSAACTLVYRPEFNLDERNCKYSPSSRGCITYAQFDPSSDCRDLGMNQYGCVNVIKSGSHCRWVNSACAAILRPVEVQSQYCISLQQVNAATCSLSLAGREMCKYEPTSCNCISTVNVQDDNCDTPGLNSYGCVSLQNSICLFNTTTQQCVDTVQTQLNCTGQEITRNICLNITTTNQSCHWDQQQDICGYQKFTPKDQCGNFLLVNMNSCAALFNKIITPSNSYCVYDDNKQNCMILTTAGQPCNQHGLNAHSCSAMTDENSYCYFDYNAGLCLQYGSVDNQKTVSQVQTQWAQLQLICGSLNKKGCGINIWNTTQKCFFKNICFEFDFNFHNNPSQYNCAYFTNSQTSSSPFLCINVVTAQDYCTYNALTGRCQSVIDALPCSAQYQNMHSCLFKTTNDFCQWDPLLMQCNQIAASDQKNKLCTDLINQNQCTNIKSQNCQFSETLSLCQTLSKVTSTTMCLDLATQGMTYNINSCQEITLVGQYCSYQSSTRQCKVQIKVQSQCINPGFNSGSCIARTSGACKWDPIAKQCFDLLQFLQQTQGSINTVKCSDGISKKVCLQLITGDMCMWDSTLGQCSSITITSQTNCLDMNKAGFQYNFLSCISVSKFGQNCVYDSLNFVCLNMAQTILDKCSGYQININSCLQYSTATKMYCKWNWSNLLCQNVILAQLDNQQCTDPVNQNICLDTFSGSCNWNLITLQCLTTNITNAKCSDFATIGLYNRRTCISLAYIPLVPNYYTQCGFQHDFCNYDPFGQKCAQMYQVLPNAQNQCVSYSYLDCPNFFNYDACIHYTIPACYFNGFCQYAAGNYNTMTCQQANSQACLLITTPGQRCIYNPVNDLCEIYPGTVSQAIISDPNFSCSRPIPSYQSSVTVTVNANVCSALNVDGNHCVWNLNGWCQQVYPNTQFICAKPGLNNASCLDLTDKSRACTFNFNTNQCQGMPNVYLNCADVNGQVGRQALCILVVNQGCYFDAIAQLCLVIIDPSAHPCGYAVNLLGCIQNTQIVNGQQTICRFSQNLYICYGYTYPTSWNSCILNLNKYACLQQTQQAYLCVWIQGACAPFVLTDFQSPTRLALVGDCSNLSAQACLRVAVYLRCKLINQLQCINVTPADNALGCYSLKSMNSLMCASTPSVYCSFAFNVTIFNSFCGYPGMGSDCATAGLNSLSCIQRTWNYNTATLIYSGPQCQWNSSSIQCQTIIDVTYYNSALCQNLNRMSCNLNNNPQQPCQWNPVSTFCIFVNILDPLVGPITCSKYNNQIVSNSVCSSAIDVACKYNTKTQGCYIMQTSDIALNACKNLGINRIGCMSRTAGLFCVWNPILLTCTQADDSVQYYCTDNLNIDACVNMLPTSCGFIKSASQCYLPMVYSNTTFATISDPNLILNPLTCQQFQNGLNSIAYDSINRICLNIDNTSNNCSRIGLNRQGCLIQTYQACLFDENFICNLMDGFDYSICSAQYSFYTCTNITLVGCQFTKQTCQTIDSTITTCAQLIKLNTNAQACSRTIENNYCKFDNVGFTCINVAQNEIQCAVPGLNQYGCINYTPGLKCIFDVIHFKCVAGQNINSYSCSQPLNQANCLSVTNKGQNCQFQLKCLYLNINGNTVCPITTLTNPQVCVSITKSGETCIYNQSTFMCQAITQNTLCTDLNMNQNGCLLNFHACYFSIVLQKCQNASLSTIRCGDLISQLACIQVNNTYSDVCIWISGSCGYVTSNTLNCRQLQLVNSFQACSMAIDACRFDIPSAACVSLQISDGPYLCNQIGLSQTACYQNTLDIHSCMFDHSECYAPSNYHSCHDAKDPQDCVYVLDQCIWLNNWCVNYNKTGFACDASIPTMTTKFVCHNATLVNPANTCNRVRIFTSDGVTIIGTSCMEIPLPSCSFAYISGSCVHQVGTPCKWIPNLNLCMLIQISKQPGIYKCDDLGASVSQRACQDLKRIGEYCVYNNSKCQRIDPSASTTYCNSSINIDACVSINSNNQQCFWDVFKTTFVDVINQYDVSSQSITVNYQSGTCKNLTSPQSTFCSSNLNIYACFAVTTQGQYCQWLGYLCSQIQLSTLLHPLPITMSQYYLVNSNTCTLIDEVGQAVKYDALNNRCIYSDPLIDQCLTPGINQAACLKITNQSCSWNLTNKTCSVYAQVLTNITSCSQIQSNVNGQVCSQIQIPGLLCIYDLVNNVCNDISVFPLSRCDAMGLNKFGCLSLLQDSCSWQNERCHQIYIIPDLTSCQGIPSPTNSYSCQQVSYFSQLCKYDELNQKCVLFDKVSNEICLTRGLNKQGCISIKSGYCIFANGYCQQLKDKTLRCRDMGNGNPNTCSLASQPVDQCKFDILYSACSVSNSYDDCSTPGINQLGCNHKKQCRWVDSARICQCKAQQTQMPSCSSFKNAFNCKARKDCFFTANVDNRDASTKLNFNLTQEQYELVILGTCKVLTCSDMTIDINQNITKGSSSVQCRGKSDPFGTVCLDSFLLKQCRPISLCEDIMLTDLSPKIDCKDFYLKGKACFHGNGSLTSCITFNCSLLTSKSDCQHFNKQCVFTSPSCDTKQPQCLEIQCEDLIQQNCSGRVNFRSCYWDNEICRGVSKCDDIDQISNSLVNKESTCNNMIQGNRQCGWVQTSLNVQNYSCSSMSCRFIGFSETLCLGVHVGGEVCVFIQSNCLSCEEITDPCTCLNKAPFCAYDHLNSLCLSVPCSTYISKPTCLNAGLDGFQMCRYNSKQKLCSPQCSQLFSQTVCDNSRGCSWHGNDKICQKAEILIPKIKIIIPLSISTFTWSFSCMFYFINAIMVY